MDCRKSCAPCGWAAHIKKHVNCSGSFRQLELAWQVMTRGSVQAGNRASTPEHHLSDERTTESGMQRPLQQIGDTSEAFLIVSEYHTDLRRQRQTLAGTDTDRQNTHTNMWTRNRAPQGARPESNPGFVDIRPGSPPTGPPPPRIPR